MSKPSSNHLSSKLGVLKPTAEQITNNLLILCIKNSIPFNKLDNSLFQDFLKHYTLNSFIPDSEVLNYYCLELYDTYQDYFINYFKIHSSFQCSLTFHKWYSPNEIKPYIYIDAHYVNDQFILCSIPLGFFQFSDDNLINFMINNSIFKNLSINFLTTDFILNDKCLETFKCILEQSNTQNEIDKPSDVIDKIMFSLPHFLVNILRDFLHQLAINLNLEYDDISNIHQTNYLPHQVSIMIQAFLGPIYDKFLSISLEKITFDCTDEEVSCRIHQTGLKNQKSFAVEYLTGLIIYKNQLQDQNIVSNFEWELIEFLMLITSNFLQIIHHCNDKNPTSHMILKWVKILIFQISNISNYELSLRSFQIDDLIQNILIKLNDYHDLLETKFDLILATYLHPTTKRFLKTHQISRINRFIESHNHIQTNLENVDDIIAKMFDCSGQNSIECYNYETSANNDGHLDNSLLHGSMNFWKLNRIHYPILGQYANATFSIQASTSKCFLDFEINFHNWKQVSCNQQPICDLQAIYFLYNLSNNYDIVNFDAKNLIDDIENFRLSNQDHSIQSLTQLTVGTTKRKRKDLDI